MSTPNLGLTQVPENSLQVSGPVNDALQVLDAVVQLVVEAADLTAPPATTNDDAGKRWIVASPATGPWATHEDEIALCTGADLWRYIVPGEGWRARDKDSGAWLRTDAGAWVADSGAGTGDVVGPASSVDDRIATFDGTTGELLQDGGKTIADLRAPAVQAVTSAATVTPTFSDDLVKITAQAAGLTLANPTGTAIPGLGIVIRIKDNGTARSIGYGTQYRAIGITLPTTTVISKTTYIAMIYNSDDTKWDCIATGTEA